jgi:hypothetical protein
MKSGCSSGSVGLFAREFIVLGLKPDIYCKLATEAIVIRIRATPTATPLLAFQASTSEDSLFPTKVTIKIRTICQL